MLAFIFALLLSNAGFLPSAHPLYATCTQRLLPLSVSLGLLSAGGMHAAASPSEEAAPTLRPMLLAFTIGSIGTTIGAIAAYALSRRAALLSPPASACAAGLMCATYIGGSANFFAVALAIRAGAQHPGLVPSLLAADLALMGVYLLCLAAAARSPSLHRVFSEGDTVTADIAGPTEPPPPGGNTVRPSTIPPQPIARGLAAIGCLAVAALSCHGAITLESAWRVPGCGTIALCAASTAVGNLFARRFPHIMSSIRRPLGDASLLLTCLFLASVGAAARMAELLVAGPAAAIFAATVLVVHCAVMFVGVHVANRVCRNRAVSLPQLIIASNANVGGIGTAVAMAGAMGWARLVSPAAACGAIGYAVATAMGVGLHGVLLARG
jgi:uncharacterized membrane protein